MECKVNYGWWCDEFILRMHGQERKHDEYITVMGKQSIKNVKRDKHIHKSYGFSVFIGASTCYDRSR